MAGEYSHEFSAKLLNGPSRLIEFGSWQGGRRDTDGVFAPHRSRRPRSFLPVKQRQPRGDLQNGTIPVLDFDFGRAPLDGHSPIPG